MLSNVTIEQKDSANPLSNAELKDIVLLHRQCLPTSLISKVKPKYGIFFYRFLLKSDLEGIFVCYRQGKIVGACVASLSPRTLSRRLLFSTRLIFSLDLLLHKARSVRSRIFSRNISIHVKPEVLNTHPELLLIYSDADLRGKGVGRNLLESCEEWFRSTGHHQYYLKTVDDILNRAISFYDKNGFCLKGKTDEDKKTYLVFVKSL